MIDYAKKTKKIGFESSRNVIDDSLFFMTGFICAIVLIAMFI